MMKFNYQKGRRPTSNELGVGDTAYNVEDRALYGRDGTGTILEIIPKKSSNSTAEALLVDGSIPMDDDYTPKQAKDVVTLEVVNPHPNPIRKQKRFLKYYGWLIAYKDIWNEERVIKEILENFDVYVLGAGYAQPTHDEFERSRRIVEALIEGGIEVYGYTDNVHGNGTGGAVRDIRDRIKQYDDLLNNFKTITGLYIDEFGYDYQLSRSDQNDTIGYIKGLTPHPDTGEYIAQILPTIYNLWHVDAFLEDKVDSVYNPNGDPIIFRDSRDMIQLESFAMGGDGIANQYSSAQRYEEFERHNNFIDSISGAPFKYQKYAIAKYPEMVVQGGLLAVDWPKLNKQGFSTQTQVEEYCYLVAEVWQVDAMGISIETYGVRNLWIDTVVRRAPDRFSRHAIVGDVVSTDYWKNNTRTYDNGGWLRHEIYPDATPPIFRIVLSEEVNGAGNDDARVGGIEIVNTKYLLTNGEAKLPDKYIPTDDRQVASVGMVKNRESVVSKGIVTPGDDIGSDGDKFFLVQVDAGFDSRRIIKFRPELEFRKVDNDWLLRLSTDHGEINQGDASELAYVRITLAGRVVVGTNKPLTLDQITLDKERVMLPTPHQNGNITTYTFDTTGEWREILDNTLGYISTIVLNSNPNVGEYKEYRKEIGKWVEVVAQTEKPPDNDGGTANASIFKGEAAPTPDIGEYGDKYYRMGASQAVDYLKAGTFILRPAGSGYTLAESIGDENLKEVVGYLSISYNVFKFYFDAGEPKPAGSKVILAGYEIDMSDGIWQLGDDPAVDETTFSFNSWDDPSGNITAAYLLVMSDPLSSAGYYFGFGTETVSLPYTEYTRGEHTWNKLNTRIE